MQRSAAVGVDTGHATRGQWYAIEDGALRHPDRKPGAHTTEPDVDADGWETRVEVPIQTPEGMTRQRGVGVLSDPGRPPRLEAGLHPRTRGQER
jgi:hypothetical protein